MEHFNNEKMDLDEKYRQLQQKQKETEELAKNELIKNQDFQRQFHIEKEKIRLEFERKNKEKIQALLLEKQREITNLERRSNNLSTQLKDQEEMFPSHDLKVFFSLSM